MRPWQGCGVISECNTSDWYGASKGHDAYFYQDGVHLKPAGAEAYCKIIVEALSSNCEEMK